MKITKRHEIEDATFSTGIFCLSDLHGLTPFKKSLSTLFSEHYSVKLRFFYECIQPKSFHKLLLLCSVTVILT